MKSTRKIFSLPLILKLVLVCFSAQADTTHPLTKHRKIASSFRDSSLFDIFTLSCNLLKQVRLCVGTYFLVPFERIRVTGDLLDVSSSLTRESLCIYLIIISHIIYMSEMLMTFQSERKNYFLISHLFP